MVDRVTADPLITTVDPTELQTVTEYDAWRSRDLLADQLAEALEAAQINFVRFEDPAKLLLAVAAESRGAALAALQASSHSHSWWALDGRDRKHRMDTPSALGVRGPRLRVFRLLGSQQGHYLASHQIAVEVQFWAQISGTTEGRPDVGHHLAGTRIAPVRNSFAAYLEPGLWKQARARADRRVSREPAHLLELPEPVDLVYTWVDSSDPEWQRRRQETEPTLTLATDATDPARVRSHNELRYSLRSIAMYASWVRRIWLVTDGQVPPWLIDHPKLTVVTHRDIFSDIDVLPTFNSHAIESQLHHIPGLAEHYLYFNDDVFLGRPVRPELFFHANGIAKYSVSPITICADPDDHPMNGAMHAARRNRDFMEATFGRTTTRRMQHTPHAHRRSSMEALESSHPHLVASVAQSQFRATTDVSIASDLGHSWSHATGQAVLGAINFQYIDIGAPQAPEHYDSLLARRDRDCFCLNDVGGGGSIDSEAMLEFLNRYFPVPSPFERAS